MKSVKLDRDKLAANAKIMSVRELADHYGLSTDTIRKQCRQYGIQWMTNREKYKGLEKVCGEFTVKELAELYHSSENSIRTVLHTRGLTAKAAVTAGAARKSRKKRRSQLAAKERYAHEQGMSYADIQKAETLKMYGRVEL